MFTLSLLGSARIEGQGGRLTGEAAQRHRVALLALLATARDGTQSREKLLALLWPRQRARDARHLLNVSVHVLRKALGEQALRSAGGDLSLDPGIVPSDVARFRAAIAAGDFRAATELYGGPFLDGFFLDDSPEFDRWQEAERARLAGELEAALAARAEAAERAGDWREAVQCWRLMSEHAPEHAGVTLRLMRALAATGDRGAALQAADSHVTHLASEFEAEPSPEVLDLAERIRVRPAPSDVRLDQDRTAPTSGPVPARQRVETLATVPGLRRARIRWAALGAAALAVTVAALGLRPRGVDPASVAVLPFADLSPKGDQAYLSDGLTEELLNALARIPGLRVASRSSSFQFRERGVDVRDVGRRLAVAAVVEGSVRLDGNQLRVTAQLIDTRRGYHLWSEEYDRDMADVFSVQEEIARTVAARLSETLVRGLPDTLVARATASPAAYELYLRGRHEWNSRTREGMWQALQAFQQAVAMDPRYAAAYAGLSDTWQLLPDYGDVPAGEGLAQAKTSALRAIALDSTLAAAHASLAAVLDDYDRDRAGAERAYRRAIALNPAYATARQWLAIHLADDARFDEALEEIERARRLDPLSLIINTAVGAVRYFARDYQGAVAEYRSVTNQTEDFALAWALMGRALLVSGRVEPAVEALQRSVELSHGDPSYRAVYAASLAAAGRGDEARAAAGEVLAVPSGGYVPYCELASAYLYLGDDARALELFERGFEERDPAVKHLKVEPLYDSIREHPRFRELLRRAGLLPSGA
jgi:serine/threonine-protein kinase